MRSDTAVALLDATSAYVVLSDLEGRIVDVNAAVCAATDSAHGDIIGQEAIGVLCVPRDAPELQHVLRAVARTGQPRQHEHDLRSEPTRTSIAWTTAVVDAEPRRLAIVGVDVTPARVAADELLTRSRTDQLTGLPNRAHLLEMLERLSGTGATVLFCDLNGFKAVNDKFGHAAGDAVLVEVARRLKLAVRGEDLLARLGGYEFVILAPPSANTSPEGLGRRVLNAMRQPMLLVGGVVAVVGVSVGSARLTPGLDAADVLREADAQMYSAKSLRTGGIAVRPQQG
ncbi:MAG: GGDEF domain-containing protein [Mycobacteriales bacterium]